MDTLAEALALHSRGTALAGPPWQPASVEALDEGYAELLALPPARLEAALRERIVAEDGLAEGDRHEAALQRLNAWLSMDREDARIVARAYERATSTLPEEMGRRRREVERAVITNGMRFSDFRALAGLVPWLRDEVVEHADALAAFADAATSREAVAA
jgi:hypothetical protein